MNRSASALLVAVFITTLAGCAGVSKQYVISSTNGRMEIATTRPQAVPGTDLFVYWDRVGNLQTMRQSDLAQVIER
jgi:hypothetical protein